MNNFSDKLSDIIKKNKSVVVAGFDPQFENVPDFCKTNDIFTTLVSFHNAALEAVYDKVAAIKINTAFFEQYGLEGIKAMQQIAGEINKCGLILIADAKRGDIGSTAKAYSSAFLGKASAFGKNYSLLDADALTVNPFLGFDTLEPFLTDCIKFNKGIFILVKTSNPGSGFLQSVKSDEQKITCSDIVAGWIADNAFKLKGKCGFSGLGAVIGATYPEEAVHLRSIMKESYFLIPGYGAQGGSAKDALAGFAKNPDSKHGGAIINISRALFANFPDSINNYNDLKTEITNRINQFNTDINSYL